MSLMTREDMLRELELLPVWTLRSPQPVQFEPELPVQPQIEAVPSVAILEPAIDEVVVDVAVIEAVVLEETLPESQVFRHIISEDSNYLFVLPDTSASADEERLLRNIFMAMKVKTKSPEVSVNTLDIFAASNAKLIITMGEKAAQSLLQTTESLENLRGKTHAWQGASLVATYDVAHLLLTSTDKAKAWDDICLAMQALQDIK